MSDSVMEMLMDQLGPSAVEQIGKQLGTDRRTTNRAVAGALPVLLQAMTRNATSSKDGAESLLGALTRDHGGGILDNLSGFLGAPDEKAGDGILGHLLGGERQNVAQKLGATSGLDTAQIGKILAMLAPIVMGAVGKKRQQSNLDAGGLTDLLRGEETRAAQSSDLGGLGRMLDADGDGQFVDDLARMGSSILGGFLKKR